MIPVTLDCEWESGLEILAPPLACVAIGDDESQTLLHHTEWVPDVACLLANPGIQLVGHYIASDMVVLANEAPEIRHLIFDAYEQDRITCTQIRQKLCDIAGGVYRGFEDIDGETTKLTYGLADLAGRHLKVSLDKGADTWRLRYGELRPLPLSQWPEDAIGYPLKDVAVAHKIFLAQEQNSFFLADQYRQARASFWLRLMTTWGIRTDERGIRELAERTQKEYDKIAKDLTAAGLLWGPRQKGVKGWGKPGSRNTKAAHAKVTEAYHRLGKSVPLTDGGKSRNQVPCLDRVTCEESGDPILGKYARLSSLKTTLTKDIPQLLPGISSPIHPRIEDVLGTARTAMKPNFQNLKRDGGIRECVVPRCLKCQKVASPQDHVFGRCLGCGDPLTVLWSCDYGGLELCTLAQACVTLFGKSQLANALNEGKDPHMMLASQILGRPYDELKVIKKAGTGPDCRARFGKCQCSYCIVSNARQTGKVGNFGFPGGLGTAAMVFFALNNYGVHLTEADAIRLKKYWLDMWPEMHLYFRWISRHTDKPFPQIEQLFSKRYRGGLRYTEACNTVFQGLGADIAKSAGWDIFRAMYDHTVGSVLYGSRGVNFVHDEFVGESPITIAHECAYEVRTLMLAAAKPWLPDVNIDVEPALMWRYSKEAGPKYACPHGCERPANCNDGRLIPWTAA